MAPPRTFEATDGGHLTALQRELAEAISAISQEGYAASWMMGVEYACWDACHGGRRQYGNTEITDEQVQKLLALSLACGGWIVWSRQTEREEWVPRRLWLDEFERARAHEQPDPQLLEKRAAHVRETLTTQLAGTLNTQAVLLRELQKLNEPPPPKRKAMSCCYDDCDEDPQIAFLDGNGTFCAYHGLLNLLIPAGPTVVQQVLQDAHPLWQVQVITVPTEPGTQVPPDPAALGTDVHELHADLSQLGEREWIFTFGSGHELNGESLGKRFVRIRGTALIARGIMLERFGIRWSHQYATEEAAGVQQFGLTELPLPPAPEPDGSAILGSDLRGISFKEPRDG